MKTQNFSPHIFFVCFLFVLGNAVFTLPINEFNPFIFVLLSGLLSLTLVATSFLMSCVTENKFLFFALCFIALITSVFGAISTFLDYYRFLTQAQMPYTNSVLIILILVITGVILSSFRLSAVLKYCLFTGIISITIITLCFIAGIKNYDFSSFKLIQTEKIFSFKVFIYCFSPTLVLPFLFHNTIIDFSFKSMFVGTLAGFITLLITCLQTVLTLGLAGSDFSYLKTVSTISTGSLFSRLDGLVFFVCFASSIIKIIFCCKAALFSFKNIFLQTK